MAEQTKKEKIKLRSKVAEKAKASASKFKKEVKKELNTAFLAAFGFLIALIWKDLITEYVDKISQASPLQGKFISALLITIICVAGIMIVSSTLKTEN